MAVAAANPSGVAIVVLLLHRRGGRAPRWIRFKYHAHSFTGIAVFIVVGVTANYLAVAVDVL